MSLKYSKFDSFLKRILNNKDYKNVKTYEPCVLLSTKEKYTFRFTFLTSDRIYITENPPKSLLYSVDFKDVIEVHMVNDKAHFLQAHLRDRVQHVVIRYINADGINSSNNDTVTTSQGFDRTFSSRHTSTIGVSQSFADKPSSSKEHQTPLLCSYAKSSVADSHTISDSTSSIEPDILKPSTNEKRQLDKNGNILLATSGKPVSSVNWEYRDPYRIHVLLPSTVRDSSATVITEELHLYILSENTTFLLMLKALWRNYIVYHSALQRRENIVQSTLQFDEAERAISDKSASMDENTKTLFAELKQELQLALNIEQLYGLFSELKTAAINDILIKSLFWKDDVLLKKSMNLINKYVKQSVSVNVDERADEIELAILVLQAIAVIMRETEAIPQCYRVLQNISLAFFKDVIESLLCSPRLLCDSWILNDEIKSLVSECTVASSEVLYEIINACQQISWVVSGKSPVFGTTVLFNAIDTSDHLRSFLDHLIHNCITIWGLRMKQSTKSSRRSHSPRGPDSFTPENALKVFYLFTVFHRIIVGSIVAAQHVKFSFREEFKYYINAGSVLNKFPDDYPISGMARSVVHTVGSYIMNNTK